MRFLGGAGNPGDGIFFWCTQATYGPARHGNAGAAAAARPVQPLAPALNALPAPAGVAGPEVGVGFTELTLAVLIARRAMPRCLLRPILRGPSSTPQCWPAPAAAWRLAQLNSDYHVSIRAALPVSGGGASHAWLKVHVLPATAEAASRYHWRATGGLRAAF
jgi:hypothetical protein